ncbi:MAG TPA: GAF domain-containing protein [Anaerolineales bacterium]|nr:GAF domain-containing protein [Anaerolineales bacterium]
MLKRVLSFFKPPVFPEDQDKTRKASYAHAISLAFTGLILLYELYLLSSNDPVQLLAAANMVIIVLGMVGVVNWWLVRQGKVSIASLLLVGLFWIGANGLAASGYGIRDTSFIVNFVVMLVAALLLGWWAAGFIAIASILVAFGLANREAAGLIVPPQYAVTRFAVDISAVLVLGASFIYILVTGLEKAIKQSRNSLKDLEAANAELHHAQSDLRARSTELVATNEILQKRTERLRAVAEVARTATAVQDFDQLLPLITNVVSKQLGYYHVGIFLLDESHEYAILRAANTQGGLQMLARDHRLKVGEQGIVGFVAYQGRARVALDVGQEAVFFNNPDLPDTHSEVGLPLKFGQEIIGVLDIQSTKTEAFSQEDVDILTVLADQVSVAIQNARSFEQAQRALREAETASSQLTREAWSGFTENLQSKGFRFDGIKSEPLKEAQKSGLENDMLSVPVELRGQLIGRLKLKASSTTRKWTEDELAIIESTADRIALALESARLLEEAQKRAAREAFLSTVGAKLGASFQLDSILRDTVEELGQTLKSSTVSFQLVNPSAPPIAQDNGGNADERDSG